MYSLSTNRSVLAQLRAVPTGSPDDPHSSLELAERQATLLRQLAAHQQRPIEDVVTGLPHVHVTYDDLPLPGLSYWNGQQWVILINSCIPHAQQRHVLLHEFKHVIDHPTVTERYIDRPGFSAATQMERAADRFASTALSSTSDAGRSDRTPAAEGTASGARQRTDDRGPNKTDWRSRHRCWPPHRGAGLRLNRTSERLAA